MTPRTPLAGDLNSVPGTPPLQLLGAMLRSAYESVHGRPPPTTVSPMGARSDDLPGDLPVDYILVSPGVEVLAADLALTKEDPTQPGVWASDHVAVVADLRLG